MSFPGRARARRAERNKINVKSNYEFGPIVIVSFYSRVNPRQAYTLYESYPVGSRNRCNTNSVLLLYIIYMYCGGGGGVLWARAIGAIL